MARTSVPKSRLQGPPKARLKAEPNPRPEVPRTSKLSSLPRSWLYTAAVVLTLGLALGLAWFPCRADDIFMHLAVGRRFFREGHLPVGDPFLFSKPEVPAEWRSHWAAHLGAYLLYSLGGWDAIVLLKIAVVILGAAAPFWLARRVGYRSFLTPALVTLVLWASCDRFIERSSTVSDVAGAWVLAIVCAERKRPSRWLWALPPIFLVWTSTHPSVPLGLGFVGAALVTSPREWRRWGAVLGAALVATCIHPRGLGAIGWGLDFVSNRRFQVLREYYHEWMSTFHPRYVDSLQVRLFVVLLGVVAVLFVTAWGRQGLKRVPWYELIVGLVLAKLGTSAIRYVTTAGLALGVLTVQLSHLARLWPVLGDPPWNQGILRLVHEIWRKPWAWLILTTLCIGALGVKVTGWGYESISGPRSRGLGLDTSVWPIEAFRLASQLPKDTRIFNEHGLGVALAWLWDGNPPIYFHGYIEDGDFFLYEYTAVNQSPEQMSRIVRENDIGAFMVAMPQISVGGGLPILHQTLLNTPGWHLCHWDGRVAFFVQERPSTQEFIRKYAIRYVQPFYPQAIDRGLAEDQDRVFEEAYRILRAEPDNEFIRRILLHSFGRDPDALLLSGGAVESLPGF